MCGRIYDAIASYAEDVYYVTSGNVSVSQLPWRFPYFRNDYGTVTEPIVRIKELNEKVLNPKTGQMEPKKDIQIFTSMEDQDRWNKDQESRREIRVWVPIILLACLAGIALVLVIHKYAIKKP